MKLLPLLLLLMILSACSHSDEANTSRTHSNPIPPGPPTIGQAPEGETDSSQKEYSQVIRQLVEKVKSADPVARVVGVVDLLESKEADAHSALRDLLLGTDPTITLTIVKTIIERKDPRFIPEIAQLLDSNDSAVRESAAVALVTMSDNPRTLNVLEAVLADREREHEQKAMILCIIGESRRFEFIPVLIKTLQISNNNSLQSEILAASGKIARRSFKNEEELLTWWNTVKDKDEAARLNMIITQLEKNISELSQKVKELQDECASMRIENLDLSKNPDGYLTWLSDSHPRVRLHCLKKLDEMLPTLEQSRLKEISQRVRERLYDDTPDVVKKAVELLGKLKTEEALPELKALFETNRKSNLRKAIVEAVAAIGGEEALHFAVKCLASRHREVKISAIRALGKLRDPRAIPELEVAFDNDDFQVRQAVVDAIGEIVNENHPIIERALKDNSKDVRWSAAHAAGKIGDPSIVDALVATTKDDDPAVRQAVAESLGKLKHPSARPALVECLVSDSDERVREFAARALGAIGDPAANDPLIMALDDEKEQVRQAAWASLVLINHDLVDRLSLAQKLVHTPHTKNLVEILKDTIDRFDSDKKHESVILEAKMLLADAYERLALWRDAIPLLAELWQKFPEKIELLEDLFNARRQSYQHEAALQTLALLLEKIPPSDIRWWRYRYEQAAILFDTTQYETALEIINKSISVEQSEHTCPEELTPMFEELKKKCQEKLSPTSPEES